MNIVTFTTYICSIPYIAPHYYKQWDKITSQNSNKYTFKQHHLEHTITSGL